MCLFHFSIQEQNVYLTQSIDSFKLQEMFPENIQCGTEHLFHSPMVNEHLLCAKSTRHTVINKTDALPDLTETELI